MPTQKKQQKKQRPSAVLALDKKKDHGDQPIEPETESKATAAASDESGVAAVAAPVVVTRATAATPDAIDALLGQVDEPAIQRDMEGPIRTDSTDRLQDLNLEEEDDMSSALVPFDNDNTSPDATAATSAFHPHEGNCVTPFHPSSFVNELGNDPSFERYATDNRHQFEQHEMYDYYGAAAAASQQQQQQQMYHQNSCPIHGRRQSHHQPHNNAHCPAHQNQGHFHHSHQQPHYHPHSNNQYHGPPQGYHNHHPHYAQQQQQQQYGHHAVGQMGPQQLPMMLPEQHPGQQRRHSSQQQPPYSQSFTSSAPGGSREFHAPGSGGGGGGSGSGPHKAYASTAASTTVASSATTQAKTTNSAQSSSGRRKRRRYCIMIGCLVCCIVMLVVTIGVAYAVLQNASDDSDVSDETSPSSASLQAPVAAPIAAGLAASTATPTSSFHISVANVNLDLIGATSPLSEVGVASLSKGCRQFISEKFTLSKGDTVDCSLISQEVVQRERPVATRRHNRHRHLEHNKSNKAHVARSLQDVVSALRIQVQMSVTCATGSHGELFEQQKVVESLQNSLNAKAFMSDVTESDTVSFATVEMLVLSDDQPLAAPDEHDSSSSASVAPVETGSATIAPTVPSTSFGTGGGAGGVADAVTVAPAIDASMSTRDYIMTTLGAETFATDGVTTNPYLQALDWITTVDPMQMTSVSPNLLQRFAAAYLYHATSTDRPWASCGPAVDTLVDDPVTCTYLKLEDVDAVEMEQVAGSTRWLSSVGECTWVGVQCNGNAQITSIELHGMQMTGTFPEGLRHFPMLSTLSLTSGELSGSIPSDALSQLTSLVNLDLQRNTFTGAVPWDGLYALENQIQHVFLSNNNMTGSIPDTINRLQQLNSLLLAKNEMTGVIPATIGDLSNLQYLRLNSNTFVGSIPPTLASLSNLIELSLKENQLTGTFPSSLSAWTSITDLRVYDNLLIGSLPDALYSLGSLTRFEAQGNQLTGTLSSSIGLLTNLQTFRISNNAMAGALPSELATLAALTSVWLFGNAFIGSVPAALCPASTTTPLLAELVADCRIDPVTNVLEVTCPCCTMCCDSTGQSCVAV